MATTIDGNPLGGIGYTTATQGPVGVFGRDGASFKDVLDTVNPLQQLPVVGAMYRGATGDTIAPAAKIAGGALFGGPIGLALAALDSVVEMASGGSVGDHVMAGLSDSTPVATMSQAEATREAAAALALSQPAPAAEPTVTAPVSLTSQLQGRNALVYGRQQGAYAQQQAMESAYGSVMKVLS